MLDGGCGAWARETRPVQIGVVRRYPTGYHIPAPNPALIRDLAGIEQIVAGTESAQLVDCRSGERFRGEVDEPRAGLARGHIPGSANIPFTTLTDPETGRFRTPPQLATMISESGLDITRPIVASCGSGVTACTLALAVEVVRAAGLGPVGPPVAIYDGSWSEWGQTAR